MLLGADRAKQAVKMAVIGVFGWFVFDAIRRNWAGLVAYDITISYTLFVASILLLLLAYGMVWGRWVMTVRMHGEDVAFLDAGVIYWLFQLSTYVPGGVWQYISLNYLSHGRDISKRTATTGTLHHQILGVTGATITFLGFGGTVFLDGARLVLAVAGILLLSAVASYPPLLARVFSFPLQFIGREPISFDHSQRAVLKLLLISVISWTLTGAAFYLLAAAIGSVVFTPAFIAILPGAWVVGFALLLAPGGLGVREAALIAFLSPLVSDPLPVILSLASRIWMLLPELVFGGMFVLIDWKRGRES